MRWRAVRIAALVVVPLLAILFFVLRPPSHKAIVKAYFTNAMSLRPGAAVRLAGVQVGSVKSVRAMPELKQAPVEVVILVDPPYELKIPSDSVASLETAGILGETFVEIDTSTSSGPPVGSNGVLKTKPAVTLTAEQVLEKLTDAVKKLDCDVKKNVGGDKSQRLLPPTNPSR